MSFGTSTGPVVRVLTDPPAVFSAAAIEFLQRARTAIKGSGRFTVALSGGSTPKNLYSLLATQSDVPWDQIHFFFSDERHVPPGSPDSNYRMANESLFSQAPIPKLNIYRIPAEIPDADNAAQSYEQTLRKFFQLEDDELPRFDLILLGMGPDGHTASLFPGTAALHEDGRIVTANWVEKYKTWRITFTYPAINHAAAVLFMATGAEKQEALLQVLQGKPDPETYPAQGIKPTNGSLIWLVDQAAAGPMK